MSYYTGKGDDGRSGLLGAGRRVKDDPIFNAIGEVDELNSAIGVALYYTRDTMVRKQLKTVQNELFIIGANLASPKKKIDQANLGPEAVARLEGSIEDMGRRIPRLKKFVIPGGCEAAAHMHLARSVARRAERSVIAASGSLKIDNSVKVYMNRLSSYLFVAALYLNYTEGVAEAHPTY
ncbi:MAG: cob(I)yrinic acid a,c-diamide adenosyltransferase [Candidatus Micrarchaeota archaeon]|nr:cob(I)yrinic acid a,c-diamide adenosyltransferase [Candidatus Micrarchaeota archaeon]